MVTPALYETTIHHVRQSPFKHAFTYQSYWWLVDLDALPSYGLLGRFRAKDHVGSGDRLRQRRHELDTRLLGEPFGASAPALRGGDHTETAVEPDAGERAPHRARGDDGERLDRHGYPLRRR